MNRLRCGVYSHTYVHTYTMEYYSAMSNNESCCLQQHGWTRKHYAKWNMSNRERQKHMTCESKKKKKQMKKHKKKKS